MDATQTEAARNLLRRLNRLVGCVTFVPGSRPGTLVAVLAPGDIWRLLPALINEACDLAVALGDTSEDVNIRRDVAALIDNQPAPGGLTTHSRLAPSRN